MSQNDMSVANASGATVRADINSALQALASMSSGSSAPGTTYANQPWFDTANDIQKFRDEANANWVNGWSLVGTTFIPYSNGALLGTLANLNYAAIAQNLTMDANKHVAFDATAYSSGTPNFATGGNVALVSGTATANSLGTVQEGFIGIIHYAIAITLTHNATSRDLPTGADILTANGDCEIVMSKGSGNWRTVAYMRKDGTALVGSAASQAQMEAASSTAVYVTPGRLHFHPSVPKTWVKVDASGGTPAADVSRNVTGLDDVSTGVYDINYTTAASVADYVVMGMARRNATNDDGDIAIRQATAPGTADIRIATHASATLLDSPYSCVGILQDFA